MPLPAPVTPILRSFSAFRRSSTLEASVRPRFSAMSPWITTLEAYWVIRAAKIPHVRPLLRGTHGRRRRARIDMGIAADHGGHGSTAAGLEDLKVGLDAALVEIAHDLGHVDRQIEHADARHGEGDLVLVLGGRRQRRHREQ